MENQTKIENLLPLYFEGKTTLQENERIEAWLNANEEHARIASQLNMLYLATDIRRLAGNINMEKAWNKVKGKTPSTVGMDTTRSCVHVHPAADKRAHPLF